MLENEKRYAELALRAAYQHKPEYTRFLEPSEETLVRTAANRAGVQVSFFGGTEASERRRACFFADEEAFAPVTALEIAWNSKYASVGHRDLLGAVLALGFDRSAMGDICPGDRDGLAYLFCMEEMAEYIIANFEKAGRAGVRVRRAEEVHIAPPKGTSVRVTVRQPRLDAVLAAAYRLSRAQAQKLIAQGLVKRNHVVELRGDCKLDEGDLLSARGFGRVRVEQVEGETRKGRVALRLFCYGNDK